MRICTSGSEIRRAFRILQDGILISEYRLNDETVDQIAETLSDRILILCVAKPDQLTGIESPRVFKARVPLNSSALTAYSEMLVQLHYRNAPKRNEEDNVRIQQAKEKLMEERRMSEADAYRFLQKSSMKLGLAMAQIADRILQGKTI
jgi:response regulator NasT